jgi:uncharacterized membrane protein
MESPIDRTVLMISRWQWLFLQFTRRLWVRAALISLLAVVAALVSFMIAPYLPDDLSAKVGADAVDNVLSIIASSMLAVTTFSLSTMVAAYSAATSNVTPRATKLLIADSTTQNALATFIGSFLFSLVALVTLSMGAYGERGRVVLFVVTILVILLIVVTLLRWIDYLQRLGRVGETTELVEKATRQALNDRRRNPYLGGARLDRRGDDLPPGGELLFPEAIGYVQHVDVAKISKCADEQGGAACLAVLPGAFVDKGRPLAHTRGLDANARKRVREAFTLGSERSYDQDPRFGAAVLAEIGSRALSPATNDPGTAIDVIGRGVRLLAIWADDVDVEPPRYPNVFVPELELDEFFDDLFTPIARDGAQLVEVQVRLQKAFGALARTGDQRYVENALRHSQLALRRAEAAMSFEPDIAQVRAAAAAVGITH